MVDSFLYHGLRSLQKKQELGFMPQVLVDLQHPLLQNPEIMQQM